MADSRRDMHDESMRVRRAKTQDLEAIVELRLALLREHPDHAIYGRLRADAASHARKLFAAQLRSDHEAMFLAERGDDVVGVLRCVDTVGSPLLEPQRYAYVSSVYVVPVERRAGVLRLLLTEAERWCAARGLDEMRLHNVAGSSDAERAWNALGFDVVEQVRVKRLSS